MTERHNVSKDLEAISDTLRFIALSVSGDIQETVKWGWPTFVYRGNLCNIVSYKSHVNIHFFSGSKIADPEKRLEGTGKGIRHLLFKKREDIDADYVMSLVRSAIEYNESREKI